MAAHLSGNLQAFDMERSSECSSTCDICSTTNFLGRRTKNIAFPHTKNIVFFIHALHASPYMLNKGPSLDLEVCL